MEFQPGIESILHEKFKSFFANKTGQELSKYNEKFLLLNIKERLTKLGISSFREYFEKFIIDNEIEDELEELFNLIINKESDFFRYPDQFEFLQEQILPELILKAFQENKKIIKIASIGFAKGQELYSIAMILKEYSELLNQIEVKLEGFDILKKNITSAKKGIYNSNLLRYFLRNGANSEKKFFNLFNKYFKPLNNDEYAISDEIKNLVTLKKFNLVKDILPEKYHIIFCRNVIIYFNDDDKVRSIEKLYNALENGGYLFLGHSEYPIGLHEKFKTIFYKKAIIYKKIS